MFLVDMEGKELNLNMECKAGVDGFIDRSKVRILLCDNDSRSYEDVFSLLLGCSYQVTAVKSARQVIDALNAEGPDIDVILAEVDLPMNKGMKMLKYITRDKDLRRIPVIMMSAQDEVSTVVKCLRLGAADYLVKPLRTNELLNLWTHMWRRRHMLGLAEKNILNYDFDLIASDPSDANTNSTTLFSDDTDERSRKSANLEMVVPTNQEDESVAVAAEEPSQNFLTGCRPDVPGIVDRRRGQFSSVPKKSELKIGESSAFFTYVKSNTLKSNSHVAILVEDNSAQRLRTEEPGASVQPVANDTRAHQNGEAWENSSLGDDFPSSSSIPDSFSLERSCTPPVAAEKRNVNEEKFYQMHPPPDKPQHDTSAQTAYSYYMSGVMNQVMMPGSAQLFQKDLRDLQNHASSAALSQYNHLSQCVPHMNGMSSFPYYPMCMQPGQMATVQSWQSFGNPSSSEMKMKKVVDRREAALIKFRQKRKERCFDKKIRYANRKKLAERRPRVRGQFVRKVNGVDVDLNGQPASADYDDEEEEEEDDTSGF